MIARPLSQMERAVWLLDQAAPINGALVTHFSHDGGGNGASGGGPLPQEVIRAALDLVQARHPALRLRVVPGTRPGFVFDPAPLPLRRVSRQDGDTWRRELAVELNRPFHPTQAPLCRVVLIDAPAHSEMLVVFHHLIGDALSGVYLSHDLLAVAGALLAGTAPQAPALPLRPALEQLLPECRGLRCLSFGAGLLLRHGAQHLLSRPRKLPQEVLCPPAQRRMGVVHRRFSAAALAALSARCKQERTTVQGALCAAMLLAALGEFDPAEQTVSLGCFSAVSLRDRLVCQGAAGAVTDPIGREMGLYISQATTFHQVGPATPLWELAREVKSALTQARAAGEPFVTLPMIGVVVPWGADPIARFARRADNAAAAVGVTNLGRLDVPLRCGPLTLLNLHGAVSPGVVSPLITVAGTCHGTLTLNLVHAEPLMSAERVVALLDRAVAALGQTVPAFSTVVSLG